MKFSKQKFIFFLFLSFYGRINSANFFSYYSHKEGDELSIQTGSLTSSINPIPFRIYDLKVCKPNKLEKSEDLGDVLTGTIKYNTLYKTYLKKNEYCQTLCKQKFDKKLLY